MSTLLEYRVRVRNAADTADALTVSSVRGDTLPYLVDAPSVLGWDRWRTMDDGQTLGTLRAMLQAVSDSGRLPAELVAPFSHMLLAALDELVLVVARAPDSTAAVAEGRMAVEAFIERLLRP